MSYGDCSDDIWAYIGCQDDGTQDRLFSDACKFMDATGRCNHVRNLSLSVHGRDNEYVQHVMYGWSRHDDSYDLMASLLGASALRYLEDVRVKFEVVKSPPHCQKAKKLNGWVYKLDPAELPEHTRRVLDLEHCRLESPEDATAVSFPRRDRFALHSPSLTALTLVPDYDHFELDVPRLRTFKYNGGFEEFSMKSHTTKLARVDLAVVHRILRGDGEDKKIWFFPRFWQFMRKFRQVKTIKLKVPNIEGIAVDKDVQYEHLFTLPVLERLDLKGFSDPGRRDDAALAIANLLQCCPVLHDLRIRIPTYPYRPFTLLTRVQIVQVSDFDVSMDVFQRRFSKEMVPLMLDRDDDNGSSQVVGLPGLIGCRYRCLENHLKNVTLQFQLKELNSFEVCLARFFAENCRVLEVLQIDDGKQSFLSHLNWMVERWRENALKQRKQMECDSADSSKQRGKRKRNYRVYNVDTE